MCNHFTMEYEPPTLRGIKKRRPDVIDLCQSNCGNGVIKVKEKSTGPQTIKPKATRKIPKKLQPLLKLHVNKLIHGKHSF